MGKGTFAKLTLMSSQTKTKKNFFLIFWLKSLCLKPTIKVIDVIRTKAKVKEPRHAFWKIYVHYFIS